MTEHIDFRAIKTFTACLYDTPPKVWMFWTYEGEPGKEPRITDGDYRILKYLCKNSSFEYREGCFGYECSIKGLAKQNGKDRTSIKRTLSRLIAAGAVEMMPAEGGRTFFRVKHFEPNPVVKEDVEARLESFGIRYQGHFKGGVKMTPLTGQNDPPNGSK